MGNTDTEILLENYNPNKFYYYFCMDMSTFVYNGFIPAEKQREEGKFSFSVIPKFYCIKTLLPRKEFYFQVLKDFDRKLFHNCFIILNCTRGA
jgi:hypothetical protein